MRPMKLTIEKAVYGGAGLARHEGKAIFVPQTLPGEEVEAVLTKQKSSFAEASLLTVLTASPDRVAAQCPHYGVCGGCQYQHAAYPAQLRLKQEILLESLERAGLKGSPVIGTHAGEPWGYRNRIRLHVEAGTHAVGYLQRGSHRLLAVEVCPIAAPLLQQTLQALQEIAAAARLGDWCAEAELFTNHDSTELLLSLEGRAGDCATATQLDRLCSTLAERIPQLRGAAYTSSPGPQAKPARQHPNRGPRRTTGPSGPVLSLRWGAPGLTYQAAGAVNRVSAGAFFQANRFLVDTLALLATQSVDEGTRLAWDVFAGVGLFASRMSIQAEHVIAVEGAPVSAADLRHNLHGQTVIESSTLAFLQSNAARKARPAHIVLDPPRAGLGAQAAEALAQVRSQGITYVSCDPATLARDLAVLVHSGYTITRLDLIDMFPQTFHLEAVVGLRLR
jgi:23S rRNA (uracil1939-C5)-methyltransferase